MNSVDSVYNHTNPAAGSPPPAYAYLRPWASQEERLVNQAVEAVMLPGAELQQIVRPPLPQVVLFRNKFGYKMTQPGLLDVVDMGRQAKVSDAFSGTGPFGDYTATSRNMQGQW